MPGRGCLQPAPVKPECISSRLFWTETVHVLLHLRCWGKRKLWVTFRERRERAQESLHLDSSRLPPEVFVPDDLAMYPYPVTVINPESAPWFPASKSPNLRVVLELPETYHAGPHNFSWFFSFLATPWGLRQLSSLTTDWTRAATVNALSPNHWPRREFCEVVTLTAVSIYSSCWGLLGLWPMETAAAIRRQREGKSSLLPGPGLQAAIGRALELLSPSPQPSLGPQLSCPPRGQRAWRAQGPWQSWLNRTPGPVRALC